MAIAKPVLEQPVVVFLQNYLPLSQVNMKRAIVLLITNKAEPLVGYTEAKWWVHSSKLIVGVLKNIHLKITAIELAAKFWIDVQANLE